MDAEKPDYDLDEEDTKFINQILTNDKRFEIDFSTFEDMIDRLEKSSGQQIITAKEAKMLLKEDDDLILAVYDYWVEKRLRIKQPLLPLVKSDKRDISHQTNSQISGSGALNNIKQESGLYRFTVSKLSLFFVFKKSLGHLLSFQPSPLFKLRKYVIFLTLFCNV